MGQAWYVAFSRTFAEALQAESVDAVVARFPQAGGVAGPMDDEAQARAVEAACRALIQNGGLPSEIGSHEALDIPVVRLAEAAVTEAVVLPTKQVSTTGPRNRKERRQAARLAKKLAAGPKRLVHEDRYTQAAERAEIDGVRGWEDLDEDARDELLEQSGQSKDRW